MTTMTTVLEFSPYHDAWLDNALEQLYEVVAEMAKQFPGVVQTRLEPDRLVLSVHDEQRFLELLDDALGRHIENYLFYFTEHDGERRRMLKQFVGFNQQPSRQHPPLYQPQTFNQAEQRRTLLERVFVRPSSSSRREEASCVLCGRNIEGEPVELTLSAYPFVTKIKSLSGIRSFWSNGGLSGFREYSLCCARCYFLGTLTWVDSALLYRSFIGGDTSVVCLPFPKTVNLCALHEQKRGYRSRLVAGERLSNVRVVLEGRDGERADFPPAANTLLLAFLERLLADIIAEPVSGDLFEEVRRRVPDGWLILRIPEGRLKNITAHDLILDEEVMHLLKSFVEASVLPYRDALALIWLVDREGRALRDEDALMKLKEELAGAVLTGNYERFAVPFLPKPRQTLAFSWGEEGVEGKLERMVKCWLEVRGTMTTEQLDVVKRAGRALAKVAAAKNRAAMLYSLERVRSVSDLLATLSQASHQLIGMEAEDLEHLSLDALEQVTEMVHQVGDARQFSDLKNTLAIFAGVEFAKETRRGGES